MSENKDAAEAPVSRGARVRKTATTWAVFALWAVLAIGMGWLIFNLPPPVVNFFRAIFRILSAFS